MMRLKKIVFLLLISTITWTSCGNDDDKVDCTGVVPTYNQDIAPIISTCATAGCHDNISIQSGIKFTDYQSVKSGSANSKFLKAIKHQSGAPAMPPDGLQKLSDANIKLIECWIQAGKPE